MTGPREFRLSTSFMVQPDAPLIAEVPEPTADGFSNLPVVMREFTQLFEAADYVAAIRVLDAAIRTAERRNATSARRPEHKSDLAAAYANRGTAKQSAPGFGAAAAISDYDTAIRLMEALRDGLGDNWPAPLRNGLAGTYMNRGNAKLSAPGFGPAVAIADYNVAIVLKEALRDDLGEGWLPEWRNDLASAYMNRGNAELSAPGFGPAAAITDFDTSIMLREALRDDLGEGWLPEWRNDLASAYMNRGNAKLSAPGFGPAAAITDFDTSIMLREALRDDLGEGWLPEWRNDLASAYVSRGNAKADAPGFGSAVAIADYDAAILLKEALRDGLGEGWPSPWRNDLAAAYMNRGVAKQSAPGFGPTAAIADYDAAILLKEALRDGLGESWPVPWRNDLAHAYMNRGIAKALSPSFGPTAAIADFDAAITLKEALRDGLGEGWPTKWRNDLAAAYMNRGNAKRSAPGFDLAAAIADHDAAIVLGEALRGALGAAWPPDWRATLGGAYCNRGNAVSLLSCATKERAVKDYDTSLSILAPCANARSAGFLPHGLEFFLNATLGLLAALPPAELDQATEIGDEALRLAREAARVEVDWYRPRRARIFAATLDAYLRAQQPHFLPEIIEEELDPTRPGTAPDSSEMHIAAAGTIARALIDDRTDRRPLSEETRERLKAAERWLFDLRIRRFAGTASLARANAEAEAARSNAAEGERILDRQVTFRPLDPLGFVARAGYRALHGAPGPAEADLLHAARLTIALAPKADGDDATPVVAMASAMFAARLERIAGSNHAGDPGARNALHAAFDTLLAWLNRGLIDDMLVPLREPRALNPLAEWRPVLSSQLPPLWDQAFAVRGLIFDAADAAQAAAAHQTAGRMARKRLEEAAGLVLSLSKQPWAGFAAALITAVAKTLEPVRPDETAAAADERLRAAIETAMQTETARLSEDAVAEARAEIAAQLGPDWSRLRPKEQHYLAVAQQCRATAGMAPYAFIGLGCAVEWSLLDRVFGPLRQAVLQGDGSVTPRARPGEKRRYAGATHDWVTGPGGKPLMLGQLVGPFNKATTIQPAEPADVIDGLAIWLRRQPNAAAVFALAADQAELRRKALEDINAGRIDVAHAKEGSGAVILAPDIEPHWRTIVNADRHAFFRYLPALFESQSRTPDTLSR